MLNITELCENYNQFILENGLRKRILLLVVAVGFIYIKSNSNYADRNAIQHYRSNCIIGKHTVGCYAHVMTAL